MMSQRITVTDSPDQLAGNAAERIVAASALAIEARGVFNIALSGGSTPEKMFGLLAAKPHVERIDWSKVRTFFGDERYVAATDDRSNYCMAHRSLLRAVPIPAGNVFAVDTASPTVQLAARRYESLIIRELGSPPVFDLVLLGLGDDGHTASLFPDSGALNVRDRWVIDSAPGILPPPVSRITLTLAAINLARNILFLVAGDKKAEAVRDVLQAGADLYRRPAAGVRPAGGQIEWLLDKASARLLENVG